MKLDEGESFKRTRLWFCRQTAQSASQPFFYALNAYLMASEHLKRTLKLTNKVPRTTCSISLKTEEINLHKKFSLDCTMDYINMY